MKMAKRICAILSAAMMISVLALMVGCNGKIPVQENVPFDFPYPEHVELTWWYGYDDTYFGDAFTELEDHPYMKRMEERTNVHVDFVAPTATDLGGLRGELEGMIASGSTTDMVTQGFFSFSFEGNTLDAAIDEEVYLPLNELIGVQMPNFSNLMDQYAIIEKIIRTPQNNIIYIPRLTGIDSYTNTTKTNGLLIRKDFLDQIQEDVPVTVADWEDILTKIQLNLGVDIPLATGSMIYAPSMSCDVFITCYDQMYETYLDKETGKVAYGATRDGVKEYITMMNRWVSEGLAVVTDLTREQKTSDEVAAWVGNVDDIMNLKAEALNTSYELIACPDPVLNVGDKITYRGNYRPIGTSFCNSVYLSWDCSQPAIAAKWLDQMFSEEAYLETSYGVEGEDYTMDAEGNVTFTEKITGNADGIRFGIEQNSFLNSFWCDPDVIKNYVYTDEARAACDVWSLATNENNMVAGDVLAFTEEEDDVLAGLANFWNIQMGNLKGFINGEKPLAEWDDYVTQMEEGGIDEYISIYQAAYDRYLAG